MEKIWKNWKATMMHMDYVIANHQHFGGTSDEQAQAIKEFFIDPSTLLTMAFNLDLQEEFSRQSLIFQSNHQSSKKSFSK